MHGASSFNHLVGDAEERRGEFNPERLSSDEVHDQIEFGWLLDWNITRLRAAQNLVDIVAGAPKKVRVVRPV
jgi:hypothetical protein